MRKVALTAHLSASVGWLGSVAAFLVLALAALTSEETDIVRAAYPAMELMARFIIIPLALASLMTGFIQSLGTPWGLFRHYWVLAKLLLTLFATVVLLMKMELIGYAADLAAQTTLPRTELRAAAVELTVHAAGGLLVLLVPTMLSVFKPRGLTPYGRRRRDAQLLPAQRSVAVSRRPDFTGDAGIRLCGESIRFTVPRVYVFGTIAIVLALHFVALHLTGSGFGGH